jgi:putative membrane protein
VVTETVAAATTVAAMIATPLARRGSPARARLAHVVIGGLLVTTTSAAARRWGPGRATVAVGAVAAGTAAVELAGTRTGWPFGRYRYTDVLALRAAGLPLLVPAAWAAMALPAREAAHAALADRSRRGRRIVLGAATLAAWDLFLDPQMVAEGYWRWARCGAYRGIPLSNFAGWLATGAVVMATLDRALPPAEPEPVLVAEYAAMAAMETLAFAVFFGDRVVALAGGLAMAPVAALAATRTRWRR